MLSWYGPYGGTWNSETLESITGSLELDGFRMGFFVSISGDWMLRLRGKIG